MFQGNAVPETTARDDRQIETASIEGDHRGSFIVEEFGEIREHPAFVFTLTDTTEFARFMVFTEGHHTDGHDLVMGGCRQSFGFAGFCDR